MSRDKQIRETAVEILEEYTNCFSKADEDCLVEMLNKLASEVARAIFAEIETSLKFRFIEGETHLIIRETDYDTYKKKHTEDAE